VSANISLVAGNGKVKHAPGEKRRSARLVSTEIHGEAHAGKPAWAFSSLPA